MGRGLSWSVSEYAIVVDLSIGRNTPLPPPDALGDRRHPVAPTNVLHVNASLPHRRSQGMYSHHERQPGGREAREAVGQRGPTVAHAQLGTAEKTSASSRIRDSDTRKTDHGNRWPMTSYRSEPAHAMCHIAIWRGAAPPRPPCCRPRPIGTPGSGPARRRPPPPRRRLRRCGPCRAGRSRPRRRVSAAGNRPLVRLSTSPNRP